MPIPVGASGEFCITVTDENAISFLTTEEARVLATPWLIMYLELTARNVVRPYLSDEEDTVGTQVNVSHLAASPIGSTVRFSATVLAVNGRRVEFGVAAWDNEDMIARGTHERAVISVTRFAQAAAAKRARLPVSG